MNWTEFIKEIKELSEKVDYKPDLIIGISRGGIIPARYLCTCLNVKKLHCVSVAKIRDKRKVITDILEGLRGENILLVEDILETGKSLVVAKEYLERKGAKVKTACLYTMSISEVTPDYSLREIEKITEFPWEVYK